MKKTKTKTITITLIFSTIFFLSTNAQDFEKNGNYISVAYGLGTFNPFVSVFANSNKSSTIGPAIIMYERGITDRLGIGRIGVGADINTTFYTNTTTNIFNTIETKYNGSRIGFMLRGAYHFDFNVKKLDFYSGVGFGFYENGQRAYVRGAKPT